MTRSWLGFEFGFVGNIEAQRAADGTILEFMPQARYAKAATSALNPHGKWPFCRLRVPGLPTSSGVYAVTSADEIRYVGIAENLAQRWGLTQYGSISPKNCSIGGQSTNCKVNSAVLRELALGKQLKLYFLPCDDRRAVERQLIDALSPPWNYIRGRVA